MMPSVGRGLAAVIVSSPSPSVSSPLPPPTAQLTSANRSLARLKRLLRSLRQAFVACTWHDSVEKGLRSGSSLWRRPPDALACLWSSMDDLGCEDGRGLAVGVAITALC